MGTCSFRLISPPMKYPPQAVIGGSSLARVHLPQFGIVAQAPVQARAPALCASLGLLPPASATGGGGIRPPGPIRPMILDLWKQAYAGCNAEKNENRGFRPKKGKKNPGESARVFPWIYSWAFPDALHPVWRPKDAGPEDDFASLAVSSNPYGKLFV